MKTPQPTAPPPAYFLSLSLENVRSFGEKQTISFARPDGRPAQWTIILGDNGVGKTTVLKALAELQPTDEYTDDVCGPVMDRYNWKIKRRNEETAQMFAELEAGAKLPSASISTTVEEVMLKYESLSDTASLANGASIIFKECICYGYGAGRSTGISTLSEDDEEYDTCESIFNDRANLINPEEWFLQLDYSIRPASC